MLRPAVGALEALVVWTSTSGDPGICAGGTGDVVDAPAALVRGLVTRVVPDAELDRAVDERLGRTTCGSRANKAWGNSMLCARLDRLRRDAYLVAMEARAGAGQTLRAVKNVAAFPEKRGSVWTD